VLSHFVPPDDAKSTDAMWPDAARQHCKGAVSRGRDLLEI
jgi:hypothetical protein